MPSALLSLARVWDCVTPSESQRSIADRTRGLGTRSRRPCLITPGPTISGWPRHVDAPRGFCDARLPERARVAGRRATIPARSARAQRARWRPIAWRMTAAPVPDASPGQTVRMPHRWGNWTTVSVGIRPGARGKGPWTCCRQPSWPSQELDMASSACWSSSCSCCSSSGWSDRGARLPTRSQRRRPLKPPQSPPKTTGLAADVATPVDDGGRGRLGGRLSSAGRRCWDRSVV